MKLFSLRQYYVLASLIAVILLPISRDAYAHKVNMFAYAEGANIFVEGFFSDGKTAKNSVVTVFDAKDKNKELLSGTTNDEGQFIFPIPIPQKTTMRIVLNAGMGHQTEYLLAANELTGEGGPNTSEKIENDTGKSDGSSAEADNAPDHSNNPELNRLIENAVGKAIKPVMRSISEMREERSLANIVGGIGYIFGILGIFFYIKARKETDQSKKDAKDG